MIKYLIELMGEKKNIDMKKKNIFRVTFYLLGLVILALGLILNTKSQLGVSPILSVANAFAEILNSSLSTMTLYQYILFVIVEMVLHALYVKKDLKKILVMDIFQIVISVLFTRFMKLFMGYIPVATTITSKIIFLVFGILCTGIGAAMSLDMRMIPNPGDGIVQTIADCIHKRVGFTKNVFDTANVLLTCIVSFIFLHKIVGIGIGTIACMLGVGRVIAIFNDIFKNKLSNICGIKE